MNEQRLRRLIANDARHLSLTALVHYARRAVTATRAASTLRCAANGDLERIGRINAIVERAWATLEQRIICAASVDPRITATHCRNALDRLCHIAHLCRVGSFRGATVNRRTVIECIDRIDFIEGAP